MGEPLSILTVVRQRYQLDSLEQILSRYPDKIIVNHVQTLDEIPKALSGHIDLILADPFTLAGSHQFSEVKNIRHSIGHTILIALLPENTPALRDLAVEIGANASVLQDQLAVELLPVIKRLLRHRQLIQHTSNIINQSAKVSSPLGEAAYTGLPLIIDLDEQREQLQKKITRTPSTRPAATQKLSSDSQGDQSPGPVYLRGLALRPVSPICLAGERVEFTACNHDCGLHYCRLKVTLRDNQVVKIEPGDFPDRRYKGLCLKGMSYMQLAANPERLLHPLRRAGARGSGKWERITWEQAFDEISAKIQQVTRRYCPQAMLFLTSKGQLSILNGMYGVYHRLASVLGASALSQTEWGVDTSLASGFFDTLGAGFDGNGFEDLPNSKLIIIWGGNPASSSVKWWPFFVDAQRSGARIVTIDPMFTITASKSDAWLAIKPGGDVYLALALLNVIISNEKFDADYVRRFTVGPYLVRLTDGHFLRPSHIGVGQEKDGYLVWDAFQGTFSPAANCVQPALRGCYTVNGIECSPAFELLSQMVTQYTPELAASKTGLSAGLIHDLAQQYANTKPARIVAGLGTDRWQHGAILGRLLATLGAVTGNLGVSGGGSSVGGFCESPIYVSHFISPTSPGFHPVNPATIPNHVLQDQPYPIKAMLVAFCNWFNQFGDQNLLINHVLPKLDLLVVADLFMTDTARWADYVLPAASILEREDMVKGPGPYVQYQPAMIPPPGECSSDFEIAVELSRRLGVGRFFNDPPSTYLAEELPNIDQQLKPEDFHELKSTGLLCRSIPNTAWIAHRQGKYNTPSGRVEFYTERMLPNGQALPAPPSPKDVQVSTQYPLRLVFAHSHYRVNSSFDKVAWLRELDPQPFAFIHPTTAVNRGIQQGDYVKVFNSQGYVCLQADLTQTVPPETVYLYSGWQADSYLSGHAQALTHNPGESTNAFGPNISFSDVCVEIEKFDEGH